MRDAAPAGADVEIELERRHRRARCVPTPPAIQLGADAFEQVLGVRPLLVRLAAAPSDRSRARGEGIPTIITGFGTPESTSTRRTRSSSTATSIRASQPRAAALHRARQARLTAAPTCPRPARVRRRTLDVARLAMSLRHVCSVSTRGMTRSRGRPCPQRPRPVSDNRTMRSKRRRRPSTRSPPSSSNGSKPSGSYSAQARTRPLGNLRTPSPKRCRAIAPTREHPIASRRSARLGSRFGPARNGDDLREVDAVEACCSSIV